MNHRLCLPALPLLALLVAGSALAGQDEPPPLPGAGQIEQLLAAEDVPGLAMAVIEDCQVQQVVTAGRANVEEAVPVTPQTAFEAASLSKPVFAWLVMSLVEEGMIDLDRALAEDIDYPRVADPEAYAAITPRMILSHRTGFPNWVGEQTNFYERGTPIPSLFAPGEGFSYSGEAFQMLQALIEHRTGQTLEAIFRARLGDVMPHSSWVLPLRTGTEPSRGYGAASDPESGRVLGDEDSAFERGLAAGSLITTAGDYGAFIGLVCNRQGLSEQTYDIMLAPVTDVPAAAGNAASSFALGWSVQPLGDTTLIGHDGNNGEYRAIAGFLPESREGFVILTNGANGFAVIEPILGPAPEAAKP